MLDVFAERRRLMMEKMQEGVAVMFAPRTTYRNSDVVHPYRQNSDFYYLTGFEEPEAVCLLAPGHPEHRFVMFVRGRDEKAETWTGERAGPEGAEEYYGADKAFTIEELPEVLATLFKDIRVVFHRLGDSCWDRIVLDAIDSVRGLGRQGILPPEAIVDPGAILHEMRLIKSEQEIAALRRAAAISAQGQRDAMKAVKTGMNERELQAIVEYSFLKGGSPRVAFPTIVASGSNATVLHYDKNERTIADGDLVLLDAGAEFDYQAGDITRTFPANGRFTPTQREVYDWVLAAQQEGIRAVRPGVDIHEPHRRVLRVISEGLIQMGLVEGDSDTVIAEERYSKFFMHRTSHWIGMDVHDVGRYKLRGSSDWRELKPGMVFSVEPGLYIAQRHQDVPDRYRGIGIRIEDMVVVTGDGCEVLTEDLVKSADEIEKVVGTS